MEKAPPFFEYGDIESWGLTRQSAACRGLRVVYV